MGYVCLFFSSFLVRSPKFPVVNLWSISEIVVRERKVSHVSRLSGSVNHFDVALLWRFINHDDFALTIRYRSLLLLFFFRFLFN